MAAVHPAVVIPCDNPSVKERALAQLQHLFRFNFLEEEGVQLVSYTGLEDSSKEPDPMLASFPLKSLAMLDESLRAFFWYKGYIPSRDLITERVRSVIERKVVV